ncbi:MAG: prepilin peptidase [Pseudomonadota bacterium]
MLLFVVIFCVVVALGFCLAAAWSDWGGMQIPNAYPAGIIVTFAIAYAAVYFMAPDAEYFMDIKSHLLSLVFIFATTFVLFSLKMIGAGDSKLAAAVAVWTGFKGLLPFLFFMGIAGGVLGVAALIIRKSKPFKEPKENSWIDKIQKGESAVPYGIAIAIGAMFAFYHVGYFDAESLTALTGKTG